MRQPYSLKSTAWPLVVLNSQEVIFVIKYSTKENATYNKTRNKSFQALLLNNYFACCLGIKKSTTFSQQTPAFPRSPSQPFLCAPTLALPRRFFFFCFPPPCAWHNAQQSSLRSDADKLRVSLGLCWTRGSSRGRLPALCLGSAAGIGERRPGCSSRCQCFRLPWGLEKLVIRAPCSRLLSFTLICLKQL